jgi:transcriptional regulator with GAF, ATPase, and Fis domain
MFRESSTTIALTGLLERIRLGIPARGLFLVGVDAQSKSLKHVAAVNTTGVVTHELTLGCTDSKWQEIFDWLDRNEVLRQIGLRRTGKLATLAPDVVEGEAVAIAVRRPFGEWRNFAYGVMLIELESGRTIREDQHYLLESLIGPTWLLLNTLHSSSAAGLRTSQPSDELQSKNLESLVGAESGLRTVMERVELVAPADMPVLILGDTGTGKEVVARAIHQRSARAERPFIRVNCGAIPSELIDSQLFGHEKGSFTGASDQRRGWFERANGGTLFLDEIGELPLAAQVRLLRVLQEHQIERVGGESLIHVDVRIIAATHRDLATMVQQRTFREDLWYRINMFPILLPRLCERIEDIPALSRHFAKRAAAKFGLPYVDLNPADIKQLIEYRWPGNIRELQAVMDRAVILGRGTRLEIANALGLGSAPKYDIGIESDEPTFYEVIPEQIVRQTPSQDPARSEPSKISDSETLLTLDDAVRKHIERALQKARGQIEGKRGAAKLLNINPHTLRAKMRKLGIEWSVYREP